MSRAYICDSCGLILPDDGDVRAVWLTLPFIRCEGTEDYHLCAECYERFKGEFLANYNAEGGER